VLQLGDHRRPGPSAQVVAGQPAPAGLRLDLLAPVLEEPAAEHAVPREQQADGALQAIRVHAVTVQLDVEVGAHAAEHLARVPADPVGVLHGRQLEGDGLVHRRRTAVRGRLRAGVPPDQLAPGGERRPRRHLREAELQPRLAPPAGQAHDAQRVEAEADQVLVVGDGGGRLPDELANRRAQVVDARRDRARHAQALAAGARRPRALSSRTT
jgi:hypothetical protein